jgi:putative ABC transport system permease protein
MSIISYKTWYDIWENKGRTLQVVLIIAIGAFAVGATMGAREYTIQDFSRVWRSANPPMIGLWVDPPIDAAMLEALEDVEGIETIEGQLEQGIKWRLSPDDPWQTTQLIARQDYQDQVISQLTLDKGQWPHRKTVAVERYNLEVGDIVYLEIEEKEHVVEIGGIIFNIMVPGPCCGGSPVMYTTRERFAQLTGEPDFNRIMARLPVYEPDKAVRVADNIQAHLEKQGYEVGPALPDDRRTTPPDEHWAKEGLSGVFFLLISLGVVSLVLGLFLVYNTISAIISQQVGQIGVMKALGASFLQVLGVYYRQVLVYALLALVLAVPLGLLGAQLLRGGIVSLGNMEPGSLTILPQVILTQVAIAFLSPLLIAIVPVISGARITVREAIGTYGLAGSVGLVDRLVSKAGNIPRNLILAVGNTFRNKDRVFFTQLTLVGSGVVFMMVMNTQASLVYTYSDVVFDTFAANVFLSMENEERIDEVERIAQTHPGVIAVEMWGSTGGELRPMNQPENNDDPAVEVRGLPLPAQTYVPQMRAGRWLRPDDTYAMVMNQKVAQKLGVGVGDWVTLNIPLKRESHWQIVGLLFEVLNEDVVHVPRETLLAEMRQVGRAGILRVQTTEKDALAEKSVARDLRGFYESKGLNVRTQKWETAHELTDIALNSGTNIMINLLAGMAVIIAIVGGVALSGVLSINVLERRKEIGVMRAIGASSPQIFKLTVAEGLLLGWLSWLVALPLSLPAGWVLTQGLSSLMEVELAYDVSLIGMLYWLGMVTMLAISASVLPARGATRISVRQSLAYQ